VVSFIKNKIEREMKFSQSKQKNFAFWFLSDHLLNVWPTSPRKLPGFSSEKKIQNIICKWRNKIKVYLLSKIILLISTTLILKSRFCLRIKMNAFSNQLVEFQWFQCYVWKYATWLHFFAYNVGNSIYMQHASILLNFKKLLVR
jgi:hypothetical protein